MKSCDLCQKPDLTAYINGRTQMGPWATMCPTCFLEFGIGLGIGKGQLYNYIYDLRAYRQEFGGSQKGEMFR